MGLGFFMVFVVPALIGLVGTVLVFWWIGRSKSQGGAEDL